MKFFDDPSLKEDYKILVKFTTSWALKSLIFALQS